MLSEDHHHPYTDDISSPVAAHLLDFCDDGGVDLFAAVNAASDKFVASSEDASSSSTTTHPGACSHGENTSAAAFSPMPSSFESTLSALLEDDEAPAANDGGEILLPIEYQYAAAAAGVEQQQFDQLAVAQLPAEHPALQAQMSSTASEMMQLASSSVYSDDCFAAAMGGAGGFVGLDEALCQPHPGASLLSAAAGVAMRGGCFFGKEMDEIGQYQRMMEGAGCTGTVMPMMGMDEIVEYPRMMEGALVPTHAPDAESVAASMPFGGEMQMNGGSMSPGRLPATTATETSSLEDPNFKSARISVEERREKIHRYIKKRNERNFSKKIKYACRKTLADSRPRVRGRFAKNDDYGEPSTAMQSHDEYEQMNGMKGEEDMLDSDVLQAHLSGMNCYTSSHHALESWI